MCVCSRLCDRSVLSAETCEAELCVVQSPATAKLLADWPVVGSEWPIAIECTDCFVAARECWPGVMVWSLPAKAESPYTDRDCEGVLPNLVHIECDG